MAIGRSDIFGAGSDKTLPPSCRVALSRSPPDMGYELHMVAANLRRYSPGVSPTKRAKIFRKAPGSV